METLEAVLWALKALLTLAIAYALVKRNAERITSGTMGGRTAAIALAEMVAALGFIWILWVALR
ncbi:hypothetical protein GCM10010363_60970 [Streptomyces omiyaensis]|uniref:hypothetical protein n=1 Tax=Streptomyces omiyaensis TaxID=68247 RepID=UPI001674EAAA|nr:hypothetical protein [Streptomyces omiyaensis]GGY71439.1 hypothetical protein GCM10010363_60970 [Streptomyces omiyaensis]